MFNKCHPGLFQRPAHISLGWKDAGISSLITEVSSAGFFEYLNGLDCERGLYCKTGCVLDEGKGHIYLLHVITSPFIHSANICHSVNVLNVANGKFFCYMYFTTIKKYQWDPKTSN